MREPKTVKLGIDLEQVRPLRGHVSYCARKGELEGRGKSKDEAIAALLALIDRVATEKAEPEVRVGKSGVWVAYREAWGSWMYRTPSGSAALWGEGRRSETVEAMLRHMEQNGEFSV